jgi:hypothetical protein
MGSNYYYRMALALMLSAHKVAGNDYKYLVFSDVAEFSGLVTPDWVQIVKLSTRYYSQEEQITSRGNGFRIKSMILSDEIIQSCDVLFLDSDCFVFKNSFDKIFQLIEKNSIAIYGDLAPKGQLWGSLDYPGVALKAGYKVENMWLNSGFIGRAADPVGVQFAATYEKLMKDYPFRPYITSKFWQANDEPYLATAYQLVMLENFSALPERIPAPSSDVYITTYLAEVDDTNKLNLIVHSAYLNGSFSPSIVHFLGGMTNSFYRNLVNGIVKFNSKGQLLRPYYRAKHEMKRLLYYLKRITDYNVKEARDF